MGPFLISLLALGLNIANAAEQRIAPGLSYLETSCTVDGHELVFEELRLEPRKGLELRAIQNPRAVQNPSCRNGYGGPDLPALLKSADAPKKFQILGAVNGTLFRETKEGYESNHLIWSRGAGLIAPFRRSGGSSLFVVDERGAREIRIQFERCNKDLCVSLKAPFPLELQTSETRTPFKKSLDSPAMVAALRKIYPSMTIALQNNMPLTGGKIDREGRFTHYSECPLDPNGRPRGADWRCVRAARTAICGHADGKISLITTSGAYPFDLAEGLRVDGPCHLDCVLLGNLDGGGSTQMGFYNAKRTLVMSGSRMDTTQAGCSPYRPVDNYLVIGRPH